MRLDYRSGDLVFTIDTGDRRQPPSPLAIVTDLATGAELGDCLLADDCTGEFIVWLTDECGRLLCGPDGAPLTECGVTLLRIDWARRDEQGRLVPIFTRMVC